MKKIIGLVLSVLLCFTTVSADEDFATKSKGAILIDYNTMTVLYEKNSNDKLYPASMTKMMSLLLVLEAVNGGVINWDDTVSVSKAAAQMGGSQIFLQENEIMSVQDLFKSSALASANDAIFALAEKVSGSESAFVTKMNEKAKELNLQNTNFMNVTGLHDPNHYSSAHDMAMIAAELLRVGQDDILKYTSLYEDYIREDTENKFWLVNTNKLIRTYPDMDGLKTGYTSDAKYCLTATAKRDELRLIAVVIGVDTKENRSKDITQMLDYGFANYEYVIDLPKDSLVDNVKIDKGVPKSIDVKTSDDLGHLGKKGDEKTLSNYYYNIDNYHAPIKQGDIIGEITYEYSDQSTSSSKLYANSDSTEMTLFDILMELSLKMLF